MAAVPEVVKRLADDIQWTTELGNAFLAQQADVMDAVQRMRKKAKDNGALESNEQQKVETPVVEQDTVIVVQSTNPEVIYVPTYSPVVVYGPPVYPYPPIYYPPPPPPGAAFVAFSVGVMWGAAAGAALLRLRLGRERHLHQREQQLQPDQHYGGQGGAATGSTIPEHRGASPLRGQATATKYGGSTRGAAPAIGKRRQQPAGNRADAAQTSPQATGAQRRSAARRQPGRERRSTARGSKRRRRRADHREPRWKRRSGRSNRRERRRGPDRQP